jgi:hypothetical protein
MHRFVLEQMGDFARAEAIEGPSHFRSCAGFQMPALRDFPRTPAGGV